MANTSRTLKVIFDGAVSGLRSAAAQAKSAISDVDDVVKKHTDSLDQFNGVSAKVAKGFAAIGAAAAAVSGSAQIIGGVATALTTVAPAALLIPGAVLAGAAAMVTFKIATAGVGDALKAGLSGDMEKFAEATKDMAPAMREAVGAVVAFRPQIDSLKRTVQGNFWQGFTEPIQKLGNAYLPVLEVGLGRIATSLGNVGKSFVGMISQAKQVTGVSSIMENTRKAVENAQFSVGHLAAGFIDLGVVGATYLPRLGIAIGIAAAAFRQWVDDITAGGGGSQLRAWIDGAIAGFKAFGQVVADVFVGGKAALSAFSEGLGPGGLLGGISAAAAAFREFAGSAAGQDLFRGLGAAVTAVSTAFREVLFAVFREAGPIIAALTPFIVEVAQAISTFLVSAISIAGPWLQRLAVFLSNNTEVLSAIVPFVLSAAVAFKVLALAMQGIAAIKGAAAAITAVSTAAQAAATKAGLSAAAMGRLKFALAGVAGVVGLAIVADQVDRINIAAAGGDPAKLTGMAENLNDLVGAGKQLASGDIPGIIADIQGELTALNSKWSEGNAPVQLWFATVKRSFEEDFLGVIGSLPGRVGELLSNLGTTISTNASTAWQGFVDGTRAKFNEIVADVQALPGRVGAAIAAFGTDLYNKAVTAWQQFRDGALAKFAEIDGDARTLPERIGFALGTLAGMLIAKAIEAWLAFKTAAVSKFNEIVADAAALPGKIAAGVSTLVSQLVAKATEAWEGWKARQIAKGSEIATDARALPGKIIAAISALVSQLTQQATTAWQGFLNSARAKGNEIIADARALPGKIAGAVAGLAALLGAKAREGFDAFLAACRAGANTAVAFVRGIPGMLSGAIGNLGSALSGAGRALIDGLTAGMRAALGGALAFARGIAAQIAAVKGPLSYDKTVLVPAGLALMQGLQNGLARGFGAVLSDVAAMASGINGQLVADVGSLGSLNPAGINASRPATAAQTAAALADAPTPVTYVTVKIGDTELRGIVDTQVESTNREVARVVGAGAGR